MIGWDGRRYNGYWLGTVSSFPKREEDEEKKRGGAKLCCGGSEGMGCCRIMGLFFIYYHHLLFDIVWDNNYGFFFLRFLVFGGEEGEVSDGL